MIITLAEATAENSGAKAAVLGRLARDGFAVPPGFVVPVGVYRSIVSGLDLPGILSSHGPGEVRRVIEAQPLPPWLVSALAKALAELAASTEDQAEAGGVPVAVRSSASTEDTASASAAGQHESYLGLRGEAEVASGVRSCWGSLWSARAVAYRQAHGLPLDPGIAVIVQRHIDAEVAGVLFTPDPTDTHGMDGTGGADVSTLEASWGLGESVVQGHVTPDAYTVTASGILARRLGDKRTRIDRNRRDQDNEHPRGRDRLASGEATVTSAVAPDQRERLCLDDGQVQRVWRLGREVAAHLGGSQDIEFAVENDQIWLLQARPITATLPPYLSNAEANGSPSPVAPAGVLRGTAGSPGVASGPARVVVGPGDFGRVEAGDILVCRLTDPAWTPLFGMCAGVVTETGGRLAHAAIVAREHRIPAVLGVPSVMSTLYDGQLLTIDGNTGTVTNGSGIPL